MFVEQHTVETGNMGTRGRGDVQYNPIYDNALNRARLDAVTPGTYTRSEFVTELLRVCRNPKTGNSIAIGTAKNIACGLFCSDSQWAIDLYRVTRAMNGTKTDTIVFGGKVAAPAPAKAAPAKAAKAPARKGKAKAKAATAQQQTLPL